MRRLEQPANRGTAAALAYALVRLRALGARGVLGLFPADHYYRDLAAFRGTVATVYALAERYPSGVLLVGAEADRAETDYGWIEPGVQIATERFALPRGLPVHAVRRFQEKPTSAEAARLLASGSLWNTFVVVGQTRAFEEMLEAAVPELWARFQVLAHPEALASDKAVAEAVYAGLASADLSHDVIARYSERLMVVTLPDSHWADLGQPGRVLDVIAQVPAFDRERRESLERPARGRSADAARAHIHQLVRAHRRRDGADRRPQRAPPATRRAPSCPHRVSPPPLQWRAPSPPERDHPRCGAPR